MKDILIIAPFTTLPGEEGFNRFRYIAEGLADRGHKITLITSNFSHINKKFRNNNWISDIDIGYKVVLIKETGYRNNIGLDRVKSHICFSQNLKKYLKSLINKPDIIYCAYPTMEAAFVAGRYAKLNNIYFILDVQDIWPESIKCAINLPEKLVDFLIYPLTLFANRIYSMADCIIGVSKTYVDRAKKANKNSKKYLTVYIGTDLEYFDKCKNAFNIEKLKKEFWVIYIGTLGYSYDVKTCIKTIAILNKAGFNNIKLMVIGKGPFEQKLKKYAKDLNAMVIFKGYVMYDKMVSYLIKSDIAANAINKKAQQSITNKISDYLAAGLPILNSSRNNEFMKMVVDNELGFNYMPGNCEELEKYIKLLYNNQNKRIQFGKNARKLAEKYFNRSNSYKKIYELIEKISK